MSKFARCAANLSQANLLSTCNLHEGLKCSFGYHKRKHTNTLPNK